MIAETAEAEKLWPPQLELADTGDQGAAVGARVVAEAGCGALALCGLAGIGHPGFEHRLHHGMYDLAQAVGVAAQKLDGSGRQVCS